MFNIKGCSYFNHLNVLFRFEYSLARPNKEIREYRPNSLAIEYINSGTPTTSPSEGAREARAGSDPPP